MNQLNWCTFSNLPTEIHHLIFTYLDYIRDICCDQLLFVPNFEIPQTLAEFEEKNGFGQVEKFIDFDHPNVIPFFLACKSLTRSVKSFRPSQINITGCSSDRKLGKYKIDSSYAELLSVYHWFRHDTGSLHTFHEDWLDNVAKLLKKMKRFCQTNPFKDVEFISVSELVGRNYSSSSSYYFRSDLDKLIGLLPSVKYLLCGHEIYKQTERQAVIVNAITKERYFESGLAYINKCYFTSEDSQEFIPIERLKDAAPHNCPRGIEVFLFNSVISNRFQESSYIIDNFSLNINLFSYIWNVKSDIKEIKLDSLILIMKTLNDIHVKYPSFRVFRIPIDSIEALKLIVTYSFVDINVAKNITKKFLANIELDDVQTLSRDYNIDFSKLGNYKFSAACFNEASKLQIDRNTCDIFGVTPQMISLELVGSDLNQKDKFGNNPLHYMYASRNMDAFKQFSEEELDKFGNEENMFGVTPKEISILFGYMDTNIRNFSKKFSFEGFKRTLNDLYYLKIPKLLLLDGLIVDARILYAAKRSILTSQYDYDDYKDPNFRDLNGKHLYHYAYSPTLLETYLGMPIRDVLFGKDNNQTIPIQMYKLPYHNIMDQLSRMDELPKLNFISYSDDFGMYRFQYLIIDHYINTHLMSVESECIGFDYSSGQPELVSLSPYYSGGLYHFSIEKTPLQQLRNIKIFGTVDGDDFSHYVLRYYIECLKRCSYIDYTVLKILMARGLRFDIVRNSKGQTAFNLLEELTQLQGNEFNALKKVCKKGLGNKSKARSKFSIQHKNIPDNLIVEKTETRLVISSMRVGNYRIRIKRSLYFEKVTKYSKDDHQ